MKKVLIWLVALGGGFLALLVAAVLLLPKFINVESYLPEIEKKVTEATGRSFSLGKDADVSVFPWAGVSFNNLQLGNPEEFAGGDFIKVKSFEVRVKIMPLLFKQIEITKFVLDGPEILLVKSADGSGNWSMGGGSQTPPDIAEKAAQPVGEKTAGEKTAEKGGGLSLSSLEIGEFSITNGIVTYIDKALNQTQKIDGITFRLLDVSLERPVELLFQANIDGQPISLEGAVGPIGKIPGEGTVSIDLAIKAFNELSINLKGDVTEPKTQQKFNLNIEVDSFSPKKLLQAMKMPFPLETRDPHVLNKVGLVLKVSGDPANISITDSSLTLDDSTLKLAATLKEMEKPNVAFKLDLDKINLDRYLPLPQKKEENKEAQSAPPASKQDGKITKTPEKQPIDYEPLRRLVLDGEVTVGEMIASGAKMENTVVKISGKDGIFDLDPFKLDLYQGGLNVVGNFNFQQNRPVVKVGLKSENVQVGPLLQDSIKKDVLEGSMNAVADISFTGDNAPDIKKSLNGNGSLKFLDGALVGVDIAEIGRDLKAGFGYQKPKQKPRTDFAELGIPFTLTNGLFQTDDTFLQSPLLRLNVKGTADLVSENLNMKVKPKVVGTLKGQGDEGKRSGLAIPLLVTGTFAKPEFSVDLAGLASEETITEAIKDPDSAKNKVKDLEEAGRSLLKGFGFGSKKK